MTTGSQEIAAITELITPWLHLYGDVRRPFPPLRDAPIGPYEFDTLVKGNAGGPDASAADARAVLLGRAETALRALDSAGWQLTEYPEMTFTGRVKPMVQTVGGELYLPAQQFGIMLRMTFAVDRPR